MGTISASAMRVVLLLAADDFGPVGTALQARGHEVIARASEADLLIADVTIASDRELVALAAPGTEVITIGAHDGQRPAEVIANLERPIDLERLLETVEEVADIVSVGRLGEPLELLDYDTLFCGESAAVRTLLRCVRLVARSDAPVWIFGNDGSGRGIVARAIHDRSPRRRDPFVALNTAAFSDDEIAQRLLAMPAKGSVFLEQATAAGPQTQRALVQLLDRKRTTPRLIVGAPSMAGATLSTELHYRLKVLEIEIPPLTERIRDLELIVMRMLERLAPEQRPAITSDAMGMLERYRYPGNLLELAHALTHAVVLSHGRAIEPRDLPAAMQPQARRDEAAPAMPVDLQSLDSVSKQFEREYLIRVMRSVGGSRVRAAEILGLSRKGLWGKLKSHGITDDEIESDVDGEEDDGVLVEGPWKPAR